MSPKPRRPRPRPGLPAARPAEPVNAVDDAAWERWEAAVDEMDAEPEHPGRRRLTLAGSGLLARLAEPGIARRASVGAIAAGAVLFVVASIASPLAGADSAGKQSQKSRTADDKLAAAVPSLAGESTAATPRRTLSREPTKSKDKAPHDRRAINSLTTTGIPKVALNAYRVAAARMAHAGPACGIHWSLLAAIGREESDHGRFGGATLHADGTSTPRIIGPALDGRTWDYIAAPSNGQALAGDPTYAHALGPMQFIPSTWDSYGADANGDGKADIFNINDAALGSARYLCAAGGNLRTVAGRTRAVLTYNHNDQYLAQVLALADAYRSGVPVSGIPSGNTTGGLPTVVNTGYVPPANPAAPTAGHKDKVNKTVDKSDDKSSRTKSKAGSGAHPGAGASRSASAGGSGGNGSGGGGGSGSGSGGGTGNGGGTGSGGGSGSGGGAGSGGGGGVVTSTPKPAPSTPIKPPSSTKTTPPIIQPVCNLAPILCP